MMIGIGTPSNHSSIPRPKPISVSRCPYLRMFSLRQSPTRRPWRTLLAGLWRLVAGRGGSLLRRPGHRIAVVLESLRALERILGRIHHEVVLVVVLVGDLHRIERHGDVLLARAEEAADADDQRSGLAAAVDQHIHDLADLVVARVVDVLLVPMRHGDALAGNRRQDLRGCSALAWRG